MAVFPAGGHSGRYFCDLLEAEKIPFESISCQESTRENFIVLDESSGQQFRFGMPSPELTEIEYKACLKKIQSMPKPEFLVVSGSWPGSIPLDFLDEIAAWASSQQVKLIIDSSGAALARALQLKTFLIKPNLGELASMIEKDWLTIEELPMICRELLQANKQEYWVVSMGKEGAMLVSKSQHFTFKPPELERKSTVGAGDSMVAGLIHGFSKEMPLPDILKFGIACGTAATLHPGTELCQLKDVQMILERMQ
jgi:6-phosphofructokinase 2